MIHITTELEKYLCRQIWRVIIIDCISESGNAIAPISPSVSTMSLESNDLWPFAHVHVMTIALSLSEDWRSRTRLMWSIWPRSRAVYFVVMHYPHVLFNWTAFLVHKAKDMFITDGLQRLTLERFTWLFISWIPWKPGLQVQTEIMK